MSFHSAIAITQKGKIDMIQVPTAEPGSDHILIKHGYTSLIAVDTYMTDLGFFIAEYPALLGFNTSGTALKLGPGVRDLTVGDRVTAFSFTSASARGTQEYSVQPRLVVSKIPDSISLEEAATIPDNLTTAFYTLFSRVGLPLPSSFPAPSPPSGASTPMLIYGAGTTAGQYIIQVLQLAGYKKILATASPKHHAYLRTLGATDTFDYNSVELTTDIAKAIGGEGKAEITVDCICTEPSLAALAKVVSSTGTVALLLPIKKGTTLAGAKDLSEMTSVLPEDNAPFTKDVKLVGVQTARYFEDPYLKGNLSQEIIPSLLGKGLIKPNRVRLLSQGTLKERVEEGLDLLRNNKVSGEKIVIKILA